MLRGSQISSVMILFRLTVQTNQAINFVDELGADGQVVTECERSDFSEETRVTGRLLSAGKSYPPAIMRQQC